MEDIIVLSFAGNENAMKMTNKWNHIRIISISWSYLQGPHTCFNNEGWGRGGGGDFSEV